MRNKVLKSSRTLAMGFLLALLTGPTALALPLNLEMRELRPEINPIARDVYICNVCDLAQYDAIVPPAGWEKAPARVGLWTTVTTSGPPDIPGVPLTQDFVPEIAGDEFLYVARVLTGALLGIDPGVGPLVTAQVQRNTEHFYEAGTVIHEVIDTEGVRYLLMTFDEALAASTYDLLAVGSLAGLALPTGWTYQSRVLAEDIVNNSDGLAHVFSQGNVATYQRYSVPEPALAWLLAPVVAMASRLRRGNR